MDEEDLDLRDYIRLLWRRRRTIAAWAVPAVLLAALISLYVLPTTYEASALLVMAGPRLQPADGAGVRIVEGGTVTADYLVPIVHNEVRAVDVARRLRVPDTVPPRSLAARVRFVPLPARLLKVVARDSSAAGAAALANTWAESAVAYIDELSTRETRRALDAVEARVDPARSELEEAEAALQRFQTDSQGPLLQRRVQETVQQLARYGARLTEIEQIGTPLAGDVTLDPEGTSYRLGVILARDPTTLRKVIGTLRQRLAADQAVLAAEQRAEAELLRRVELERSTYQLLTRKREELRILLGANTGMAEIAVPAQIPLQPVGPRVVRNVVVAGILGLLVGTGFALLLEAVRPTPWRATARGPAAPGLIPKEHAE